MVSGNFARFFSVVVRRYRKERGFSQELLAEKADLSSKMISLVERGERNPSIKVADSIAQGLSIPLWRLIKDAEDSRLEHLPKK
jgi:transcriptional regulator with XRE-family HTH domain